MYSTPLLSVGLFVYNGERFLEEALHSILNQTFTDFELIISDNASTDRTGEIAEAYAKRDDRIAIIEARRIWAPAGMRAAYTNLLPASIWHQPPRIKGSRSPRFSSPRRFRSPFRAKRMGNCGSSTPAGTTPTSFSRTATGKLAGVGGGSTPSLGEALTPSEKRGPPSRPPWFFTS